MNTNLQNAIQKHLYNLFENSVPLSVLYLFDKESSSNYLHLKLYEPIARLRMPKLLEITKSQREAFECLSTQNQIDEFCRYLHSDLLTLQNFTLLQLFEMLQFSIDMDGLKKMKALLGKEIEKVSEIGPSFQTINLVSFFFFFLQRLSKADIFSLAIILKETEERKFYGVRGWVSYHFVQKKPSAEELKKINFENKFEKIVFSAREDNHLLEIFEDVLNSNKASSPFFASLLFL